MPYTIRPIVKHRLRPHRSVSLPAGIMRAAITSKKMVIAVCTPSTVVSRSSLMSLIITFMFDPAKLQMNCAIASGTRIFRRELADGPTLILSATTRTPSVAGSASSRRSSPCCAFSYVCRYLSFGSG